MTRAVGSTTRDPPTRRLLEWADVLAWQLQLAVEIANRSPALTARERHQLASLTVSAEHDRGMIDTWLHPQGADRDRQRLDRLFATRQRRLAALGPTPS